MGQRKERSEEDWQLLCDEGRESVEWDDRVESVPNTPFRLTERRAVMLRILDRGFLTIRRLMVGSGGTLPATVPVVLLVLDVLLVVVVVVVLQSSFTRANGRSEPA